MHCPRHAALFLFATYAALVGATFKTTRENKGDGGTTIHDLYVNGSCRFEVTPPAGWKVNLHPEGSLAMLMTPPNTNSNARLSIEQTSTTKHELNEAAMNVLRESLVKTDGFNLKSERRNSCVDLCAAWEARGEILLISSNSANAVVTNSFVEYHKYHIRDGFLHHIWFHAPASQAATYGPAFDAVCKSYWSPFNRTAKEAAK